MISQIPPADREQGRSKPPSSARGGAQPCPTKHLLEGPWAAGGILALVVIAGIAIRVYGLYGRSMWFDESMSWRTIQFPIPEMISRVARNVHPPFYFVCLKLWTAVFGESMVALRSLSLVFAAVAMVAVFLFASEAFGEDGSAEDEKPKGKVKGRWIGLAAAALYAVSFLQIRQAWEIRMYTLGTALVALSSWILFRALVAPKQSWKPWSLFALVTLLFAYTHYFAFFSITGQAIFVISYILAVSRWRMVAALRSSRFRLAAMAYAIVAAGWAAWLPVFLRQRQQVEAGWWAGPFSFSDVPIVFCKMFIDFRGHGCSGSRGAVVALLCVVMVVVLLRRAKAVEWYVFCLSVLPMAMSVLAARLTATILLGRYLTFIQFFFLFGFAVFFWKIPGYLLRTVALWIVVWIGLWLHLESVASMNIPWKQGARGAAAHIAANRRPGEPVIACSSLLYYPMLYHAHDRTGWHVYDNDGKIPYFVGGPVAVPQDIYLRGDMEAVESERAWVITTTGGWGQSSIHIPRHWRKENEERFRDVSWFPTDYLVVVYGVRGEE